jgi:ATP-binding cassette subfamily C protein
VVAHWLTQAAGLDTVLVLDAGRVVEHGTHDELVAAGGRYAQLWAPGRTPAAPPSASCGSPFEVRLA